MFPLESTHCPFPFRLLICGYQLSILAESAEFTADESDEEWKNSVRLLTRCKVVFPIPRNYLHIVLMC